MAQRKVLGRNKPGQFKGLLERRPELLGWGWGGWAFVCGVLADSNSVRRHKLWSQEARVCRSLLIS